MDNIIHNATVDLILSRRTVRSYTEEKLTREELETLLACAMWAPSARNNQPCVVRVLTDKKALDEINTDFKNTVGWETPAYTRWNENPVYQGAPALFFIFAENKANMDGGIMVENIAVAAKSLGLDSCIIGSIGALMDTDGGKKWKKALEVDENWEFVMSIAVGHGAENPEPKPRNEKEFRIIEKV